MGEKLFKLDEGGFSPTATTQLVREELVMAGFGGQGVVLAGKLITIAAMKAGYHVSNIPSYGAEMRGGTAHCAIIVSNFPVATPIVERPDTVLCFNDPSLEKFEPKLRNGGLLLYDTSLIRSLPRRKDINCCPFMALSLAEEMGLPRAANMAFLGCLLANKPHIAPLEAVLDSLDEAVSKRNQRYNKLNRRIIEESFNRCVSALNLTY